MLISVANHKGGQGKSLWASILASWMEAELLDLDTTNGDSLAWGTRANHPVRLVKAPAREALIAASLDPKQWFVADLPPHEGDLTQMALALSQATLSPVVPGGIQDAAAWGRLRAALAEAREHQPRQKQFVVLNAARPTSISAEFEKMLREWHDGNLQCVLGVLPLRVIYSEAYAQGKVMDDEQMATLNKRFRRYASRP